MGIRNPWQGHLFIGEGGRWSEHADDKQAQGEQHCDESRTSAPHLQSPIQKVEGDRDDSPLIGVCESMGAVLQRNPSGFLGLVIRVVLNGDETGLVAHQIVVDNLVDAVVRSGEPVVDAREVTDDPSMNTGLFGDLAQGSLLGSFTRFEMAFWQAPFNSACAVAPGDQGGVGDPVNDINDDASC